MSGEFYALKSRVQGLRRQVDDTKQLLTGGTQELPVRELYERKREYTHVLRLLETLRTVRDAPSAIDGLLERRCFVGAVNHFNAVKELMYCEEMLDVPALVPVRDQIHGRKTRLLDVIADGVQDLLFDPVAIDAQAAAAARSCSSGGGGGAGVGVGSPWEDGSPLAFALGEGYSLAAVEAVEAALANDGGAAPAARRGGEGSGSGSGVRLGGGSSSGRGGRKRDTFPLRLQLLLEAAHAMSSLDDITSYAMERTAEGLKRLDGHVRHRTLHQFDRRLQTAAAVRASASAATAATAATAARPQQPQSQPPGASSAAAGGGTQPGAAQHGLPGTKAGGGGGTAQAATAPPAAHKGGSGGGSGGVHHSESLLVVYLDDLFRCYLTLIDRHLHLCRLVHVVRHGGDSGAAGKSEMSWAPAARLWAVLQAHVRDVLLDFFTDPAARLALSNQAVGGGHGGHRGVGAGGGGGGGNGDGDGHGLGLGGSSAQMMQRANAALGAAGSAAAARAARAAALARGKSLFALKGAGLTAGVMRGRLHRAGGAVLGVGGLREGFRLGSRAGGGVGAGGLLDGSAGIYDLLTFAVDSTTAQQDAAASAALGGLGSGGNGGGGGPKRALARMGSGGAGGAGEGKHLDGSGGGGLVRLGAVITTLCEPDPMHAAAVALPVHRFVFAARQAMGHFLPPPGAATGSDESAPELDSALHGFVEGTVLPLLRDESTEALDALLMDPDAFKPSAAFAATSLAGDQGGSGAAKLVARAARAAAATAAEGPPAGNSASAGLGQAEAVAAAAVAEAACCGLPPPVNCVEGADEVLGSLLGQIANLPFHASALCDLVEEAAVTLLVKLKEEGLKASGHSEAAERLSSGGLALEAAVRVDPAYASGKAYYAAAVHHAHSSDPGGAPGGGGGASHSALPAAAAAAISALTAAQEGTVAAAGLLQQQLKEQAASGQILLERSLSGGDAGAEGGEPEPPREWDCAAMKDLWELAERP